MPIADYQLALLKAAHGDDSTFDAWLNDAVYNATPTILQSAVGLTSLPHPHADREHAWAEIQRLVNDWAEQCNRGDCSDAPDYIDGLINCLMMLGLTPPFVP